MDMYTMYEKTDISPYSEVILQSFLPFPQEKW